MPEKSLSVEQVLGILAETPTRIAALTAGVELDRLRVTPDDGGWSANDVLAHLRSCADVWGDCIAAIVHGDARTLRAVNPTTWINSTDYVEQAFPASLRAFATQRAGLLQLLDALTAEDWSRSVVVTGAGAPLERTAMSYAVRTARHERPHVRQIGAATGQARGK